MNNMQYEDFKVMLNCIYQRKGSRTLKTEDKIKNMVEKAITNELTAKQAMCFNMYYKDGLTVYKIAKKLEISVPTVSIHINKARKRIYSSVEYFITTDEIYSQVMQ